MDDKGYKYLLILAMLLWGGGWSALKIITPNLSVENIVFWRFFIMSLSFVPLMFFFKEPFFKQSVTDIHYLDALFAENCLEIEKIFLDLPEDEDDGELEFF